jgi:opacity protein-like surface antigen
MQRRFLAAITLAVVATAQAGCASTSQPAELSAGEGRPPFLALSITRQPPADFASTPAPAAVRTKENQVFAGFHRFNVGDGTLDLGLDYQYSRYVYDGIDGRNRDLHRFQFPLRYQGAVSGWKIDGNIAPGISTSSNVLKEFFDRISGDDLGPGPCLRPHVRKTTGPPDRGR